MQWNQLKCFRSYFEASVLQRRNKITNISLHPSRVHMNKKRINLYDILYLLFFKTNLFLFCCSAQRKLFSFLLFLQCRSFRHTKFSFFIMFPGYFSRLLSCFTHIWRNTEFSHLGRRQIKARKMLSSLNARMALSSYYCGETDDNLVEVLCFGWIWNCLKFLSLFCM